MSTPTTKFGYTETIINGHKIEQWTEYGNREDVIKEMNTPEYAQAQMRFIEMCQQLKEDDSLPAQTEKE